MVVLGGLLSVFESVQRSATFIQERSQTLDEMRVAIDQMTKEIRQAEVVQPTSTTARLEMTSYILGVQKTIVYQASGTTLTRSVNGGASVVIQSHLSSTNVFTYTPDSGGVIQLVSLRLDVHPARRPDTNVILTSEVRIRNRVLT